MKRIGTGPVALAPFRAIVDHTADGWLLATVSGSIDENANIEGMFGQLTADTVLDMQGIERVNSMGVHRWIPLVTQFSAKHRLVIDRLSYALVQNANVVANLFGSAQIRSCMAPYYCARCKVNSTEPVTRDEVAQAPDGTPAKQCTRCSSPLEFDELDGYFAFFKMKQRR